jgi:arylsulfatase A-like enzyme
VRWPGHTPKNASSKQMVVLTDVFATCAEVVGATPPKDGAEDSISFLASALGKPQEHARTTLVNHSNFGEFAYRDGPWKLVYRLGAEDLEKSRGKPTVAELYNLDADIAEERDLAAAQPDKVATLRAGLEKTINKSKNDGKVRYDVTQTVRWIPAR